MSLHEEQRGGLCTYKGNMAEHLNSGTWSNRVSVLSADRKEPRHPAPDIKMSEQSVMSHNQLFD